MEKGLPQSWTTYPCHDLHHQVTPALLTSWHCLPQNLAVPEEERGTSGSVSGPHYPSHASHSLWDEAGVGGIKDGSHLFDTHTLP